MKTIEIEQECQSCNGTGLYCGMAERNGFAVVCHTCNGTGKHKFTHCYNDFTVRRKPDKEIGRVLQTNPGIVVGTGSGHSIESFGGMPFEQWERGEPFPQRSEMRQFVCPAWWYQSADYKLKPNWKECGFGVFSQCDHFPNKHKCWERWDKSEKRYTQFIKQKEDE